VRSDLNQYKTPSGGERVQVSANPFGSEEWLIVNRIFR
jgi:hypothetical protein